MDDARINTNGGETEATTASESTPQPAAPDHYDQHGVNPQWVEEMAPQVQSPALREHEADRGPSSGRTTARAMPKPELAGQYDRENVLSYARGAQEQGQDYDFNGAAAALLADPSPEAYEGFVS